MRRVVIACVCALALGCATPRAATSVPATALVATGRATDARAIVQASKLTVLVFFSASCPVQAAHDARIDDLYARYAPRGVAFVAIDSEIDATPERDAAEAKRRGYAFPIFVDADSSLARALGAETATFTVIADAEGRVLYAGGFDDERVHLTSSATPYVADALDDLLAGRAPRRARGKSLGCALQTKR